MLTLFHYPLFASCRFLRLVSSEYDAHIDLVEERPWLRRKEFLMLNPSGALPLLLIEGEIPVAGVFPATEYLDETIGLLKHEKRLFPDNALLRAETRRLIDWFLVRMDNDVILPLLRERFLKSLMTGGQSPNDNAPNSAIIRAARLNIRQHMKYANWLAATRSWFAGSFFSYADLAAAASLSVLDYMGEIEWSQYHEAREWYARIKSRPSFRPLLAERITGLIPPSCYADLDF